MTVRIIDYDHHSLGYKIGIMGFLFSQRRRYVLLAAGLLTFLASAYVAMKKNSKKKKYLEYCALKLRPQESEKEEEPQSLCHEEIKRDLACQGLTAVPAEVFQMRSLRILNLMGNSLTFLPSEIGQLSQLEILGLKDNRLTALPASIGDLTGLVALYVTNNGLTNLPPSIGRLVNLRKFQASFNDLQALPEEMGNMRSLELFRAAGNPKLLSIPVSLARAPSLTWLSLGGSKFCDAFSRNTLGPPEKDGAQWWAMEGHRGGRGACARGRSIDHDTSNTTTECTGGRYIEVPPSIPRKTLQLERKLGDGASGEVFLSEWENGTAAALSASSASWKRRLTPQKKKKAKEQVAVKIFRHDVSPDGRAIDELEVLCLLEHPNLSKARALVVEDEGEAGRGGLRSGTEGLRPIGVVMDLVPGQAMAAKPDHTSMLRCRWEEGRLYSHAVVLRIAHNLAAALMHLHAKGIFHGDVYAHNCVVDEEGNTTLLDYGAAFLYSVGEGGGREEGMEGLDLEKLEVRAFGLLLADLLPRLDAQEGVQRVSFPQKEEKRRRASSPFGSLGRSSSSTSPTAPPSVSSSAALEFMQDLVETCLWDQVDARPTFASLYARLSSFVAMA